MAEDVAAQYRELLKRDPDAEITATEAKAFLGISESTLARLLRGESPRLPWREDALDLRVKLVKLREVVALHDQARRKKKRADTEA